MDRVLDWSTSSLCPWFEKWMMEVELDSLWSLFLLLVIVWKVIDYDDFWIDFSACLINGDTLIVSHCEYQSYLDVELVVRI